jgi:hypothetical protein
MPATEADPRLPVAPEQKLISAPALAVGRGLTVTIIRSVAVQPLALAVTVYVDDTGVAPAFVRVTVGFDETALLKPVAGVHA